MVAMGLVFPVPKGASPPESARAGQAGWGPIGAFGAVHGLGIPLSFCSCSICKKKQNRHFIVPASRFKLLKVSAESRREEPLASGRFPGGGGCRQVARSRAGSLPRLSLSSRVSCVFLQGHVIFPPFIFWMHI